MENMKEKLTAKLKQHTEVADELRLLLKENIINNLKTLGVEEYIIEGIDGTTSDTVYAGNCSDTITRINTNGIVYFTYNGNRSDEIEFGEIENIPVDSLKRLNSMIEIEVSKNPIRKIETVFDKLLEGLYISAEVKNQMAKNFLSNRDSFIQELNEAK